MRVTFLIAVALALTIATQPVAAQSGGATVTKDGPCLGFVPTSIGTPGTVITTTDSLVILKGNGSSSVTCHFEIPAGLIPAKTTRAQGFDCTVIVGGTIASTTDTRMLASSGGRATLTCRIRNGN